MTRVSSDRHVFEFGGDAEPFCEVEPGARVVFETLDAAAGQIRNAEDAKYLELDSRTSNPATGPVAVRGARPGDTLAVEILGIELAEMSLGFIRAGSGNVIGDLDPPEARCPRVVEGEVDFGDGIRFEAQPMVGVIGVAPASGSISTFLPGGHGGNLDITAIKPGSTVYLPVAVPGAMLALGDVHARMGEGELTGGGLDIAAAVEVQVGCLSGLGWPGPVIETADAWCTTGHGPSVAEAARTATRAMIALMVPALDISPELAYILIGAAGDARFGQAADLPGVDATAWLRMPKEILPSAIVA